MNTTIYSTNDNNTAYTQLSRLAIAQITTAKKRLNKDAFTPEQLHSIQKLANALHKDKEFIIIYE